jgi:hypothetical protein
VARERRPKAADRIRAYLDEHPSIHRALADGLLNDAALARRIRQELPERLSVEAVAVALRRAERRGPSIDPGGIAARVLAGGASLELRNHYSILRLPDTEAALEGFLLGRRHDLRRAGRTILQVEEGHPYLSIACPTEEAERLADGFPPAATPRRADGFSLVLLAAASPAGDTPGVIAYFADRLAERGLLPYLMAAARMEIEIVAPEPEARLIFSALHDLRRTRLTPRPPAAGPKPSNSPAASPVGAGTTARRATLDPRSGADLAREFVAAHPSVEDCLVYGIVNVTHLARRIATEAGYDRPDAIEAALRRWRPPARASAATVEQRILSVVHGSRLEVRTRVALVTAPPTWELLGRLLEQHPNPGSERRRLFQVLQGPTSVTVLCDEDLVDPVLRSFGDRRSIDASRGLAAVVVHSPEEILTTPGVLAFLSGAIYRAGLNCLEMMSLHLESTFVVRQADALAAFGVLSDLVHPAPGGSRGTPDDGAA